jgi:uncharacterized protein
MRRMRPLPPLPRGPHIPGFGTTPDHAALDPVKARCPAMVIPGQWRAVTPYRYGFRLYDAGYFWETHEVWEPVWMACAPNTGQRHLLAGLIQVANACLKLLMRWPKATGRLLADARTHLEAAALGADDHLFLMGVSPGRLAAGVAAFGALVHEGGPPESLLARRPRLFETRGEDDLHYCASLNTTIEK